MSIPCEQRTIELPATGLVLNYVDTDGPMPGPSVVLVHGLGGRWQHWTRVIPAISFQRRVLAVDLPGFGRSPLPPPAARDLPAIADALAELIRELSLGPVIFVGHSFAGPLGTIFATRHADLTARLVLVGGTVQTFQRTLAASIWPWLTRPLTALATLAELVYTAVPVPGFLHGIIARSPIWRLATLWPFVFEPRRLDPDDARLLIEGTGARGVLPAVRALAKAPDWERARVDVPVVVINGDHDLIAPQSDLRAYGGRVDHALVLKDTGHLPMIECPDAFVQALKIAIGSPLEQAPG